MGLFSRAVDFLSTPIEGKKPAETVAGNIRNAVVDVFKTIPSVARAITLTPAVGAISAVGTFLKNRVTLNRRRLQDIWSRVTEPLSGNPWERFVARHTFDETSFGKTKEALERMTEPLDLAIDAAAQVPSAANNIISWVRSEVPKIIFGSGEQSSGATPEPSPA